MQLIRKVGGWMLLETMMVVALLSLVLWFQQRQQQGFDLAIMDLKAKQRLHRQQVLATQYESLFQLDVPLVAAQLQTRPNISCQRCQGIELKTLLSYELNQW